MIPKDTRVYVKHTCQSCHTFYDTAKEALACECNELILTNIERILLDFIKQQKTINNDLHARIVEMQKRINELELNTDG